jgi:DNA-binding XRE family transcriptional regulator
MKNLAKQIIDGGMKKSQLAKQVGVTWVTVQNWYTGRYTPHPKMTKKLIPLTNPETQCSVSTRPADTQDSGNNLGNSSGGSKQKELPWE